MREEKRKTPKNKWSQMFRKKWFFPAVYLTVAALLLTVVVWYQNIDNQLPGAKEDQQNGPNVHDEDAQSVLDPQEVIRMPVADEAQAEIVTKFFDYNADKKTQESGLILYNKHYYQSTGVGIGSADGESFEVLAALSGTVSEVKEDPLLGNVVILSHANEVETYYASIGDVAVKAGDQLKQGDKIGTAGKNRFLKDNGNHVHFELKKDGKRVNPETYFNQPLAKLDTVVSEEEQKPAAAQDAKKQDAKEQDAKEGEDAPADEDGKDDSKDDNKDDNKEDQEKEEADQGQNEKK